MSDSLLCAYTGVGSTAVGHTEEGLHPTEAAFKQGKADNTQIDTVKMISDGPVHWKKIK